MLAIVAGIFLFKGKSESVKLSIGKSGNSITPKISEVAHVEANPTPSLRHPTPNTQYPFSDNIAEVLQRVAREDGSTALCGDPGTGKSTITREYIKQVQINCSGAEMQVLAIKNDDFCGLRRQGKVFRFIGQDAIEIAGAFFNQVNEEYQKRLEVLEGGREKLTPYVIILDDWLAIVSALNKTQITFDFGLILFNILTIGREYNMKFFVNLHSLNLAAIGIKEIDSNTRKILKLLILGNRYCKDGREIDAYGIVEQAIAGGQVVAHASDKEKVRSQYSYFKAESRAKFQPVMFAFVGEYYVGLVPKFADANVKSPIHPNADIELTATDALPEPLRTIWRAAQKEGDWLTARDVARKEYAALKWRNTAAEIVAVVKKLEGMGLVEVNNEGQAIRFRAAPSKNY